MIAAEAALAVAVGTIIAGLTDGPWDVAVVGIVAAAVVVAIRLGGRITARRGDRWAIEVGQQVGPLRSELAAARRDLDATRREATDAANHARDASRAVNHRPPGDTTISEDVAGLVAGQAELLALFEDVRTRLAVVEERTAG